MPANEALRATRTINSRILDRRRGELAARQDLDEDGCKWSAVAKSHRATGVLSCIFQHGLLTMFLDFIDPLCTWVDSSVQTCYPTSSTVVYQNEYTRIICKCQTVFHIHVLIYSPQGTRSIRCSSPMMATVW